MLFLCTAKVQIGEIWDFDVVTINGWNELNDVLMISLLICLKKGMGIIIGPSTPQ